MTSLDIVQQYYQAFNDKNWAGMLALLSPEIRHDSNQGDTRYGLENYAAFLEHMDACYDERISDLVLLSEPTGARIAAEFVIHGVYKKTDSGLPEARGQRYELPVGAFLDVQQGKITRVTTYYNLPLWIKMVAAP